MQLQPRPAVPGPGAVRKSQVFQDDASALRVRDAHVHARGHARWAPPQPPGRGTQPAAGTCWELQPAACSSCGIQPPHRLGHPPTTLSHPRHRQGPDEQAAGRPAVPGHPGKHLPPGEPAGVGSGGGDGGPARVRQLEARDAHRLWRVPGALGQAPAWVPAWIAWGSARPYQLPVSPALWCPLLHPGVGSNNTDPGPGPDS